MMVHVVNSRPAIPAAPSLAPVRGRGLMHEISAYEQWRGEFEKVI